MNKIRTAIKRTPLVSKIIIMLYGMVFIANIVSNGYLNTLFCSPSLQKSELKDIYRLFTCIFCHRSLIHLAANIAAVYYAGLLLENRIKRIPFIMIFVFGGALAELTMTCFYFFILQTDPQGIGGSSAIFSVIGCAVAIMLKKKNFFETVKNKKLLNSYIVWYAILGNFFGLNAFFSHLFGFVYGFLIAKILRIEQMDCR